MSQSIDKNVLGGPLEACSMEPLTGFFRDGCSTTGPMDLGSHTVCAEVSAEFLEYSRRNGNDLITARPEFNFPGLKPGDRWCLCAARWNEAYDAGVAPPVVLRATNAAAQRVVELDTLIQHSADDG